MPAILKTALAAVPTLDLALGALLAGAFVVQAARGEQPFVLLLLLFIPMTAGAMMAAQAAAALAYLWLRDRRHPLAA